MDIQEKNKKIAELHEKRTSLYGEITKIDDELNDLKLKFDTLIGKCFCDYDKELNPQVHFTKIISVNASHSHDMNVWYNYIYVNTSDTFTNISFSMGTKEYIIESNSIEISAEDFNKELNTVQQKIKKHLTQI